MQSPGIWIYQRVKISGEFLGWKGGTGAGSPPVTRSDWQVKDNSGGKVIYVTGRSSGLDPVKDIGKPITVDGMVKVKGGTQSYIDILCTPAPAPAPVNIDLKSSAVLTEAVSSYSGNLKTVFDWTFREATGRSLEELMNVKLPDGTPKYEIVFQDRPDLTAFRYARKVDTSLDKIVGGKAEVNRLGGRLDIVLNGISAELGAVDLLVFDYKGSASALSTADWSEGIGGVEASRYIRKLEETGKYDRRMQDTQANRDLLANTPFIWTQSRPSDRGLMAITATVLANSDWRSELEANKMLSSATLQKLKDYLVSKEPATYNDSNLFTTELKQVYSNVLKERVSASSTRTWFNVSLTTP